jgi:hypothetical protein
MQITVCVTFFEGRGHLNLFIVPSDYEITRYNSSGCYHFELEPGNYDLSLEGVAPAGGVKLEVLDADEKVIAKKQVKKEGVFQRYLPVNLS